MAKMARMVSRIKRLTGYHEAEHPDILSYPEHPAYPGHPASERLANNRKTLRFSDEAAGPEAHQDDEDNAVDKIARAAKLIRQEKADNFA